MRAQLIEFLKRSSVLVAAARAARLGIHEYSKERELKISLRARKNAVTSYLDTHDVRKLQIGAGPYPLPDWLNTDLHPTSKAVIFLDATRPFPFDDETFNYAANEHLIEHVSYEAGLLMLRECYRILKPGGRIRVATPNLEKLVGLYAPHQNDFQRRYTMYTLNKYFPCLGRDSRCHVVNNFFYSWGHQFIYDQDTLQWCLEKAGFTDVSAHQPGESEDENLRGIESHGKSIGDDINLFETMVFEAVKPATRRE